MSSEHESVLVLEERANELKSKISDALKVRGGDPKAGVQRMGYGVIRVASDENRGGLTALILHSSGEWSTKVGMTGFPIRDPSVDELLEDYARLQEQDCINLVAEEEDILICVRIVKDYVQKNRERLLQGFIQALEKTLEEVSAPLN